MLHYYYLYQISRRHFKKKIRLIKEDCSVFWREFASIRNQVLLTALDKRFWKKSAADSRRGSDRGIKKMPKEGLEPSPCCQDGILNPARLPIPPLRLFGTYYCRTKSLCQPKIPSRILCLRDIPYDKRILIDFCLLNRLILNCRVNLECRLTSNLTPGMKRLADVQNMRMQFGKESKEEGQEKS